MPDSAALDRNTLAEDRGDGRSRDPVIPNSMPTYRAAWKALKGALAEQSAHVDLAERAGAQEEIGRSVPGDPGEGRG